MKKILNELDELKNNGIISDETAEKIRHYYEKNKGSSQNRLFVVFGMLGAVLVGLGLMLIIAHNWDEFGRGVKTALSFLPLVGGQVLCVYALLRRYGNAGWMESTAGFLFFSTGACISLISQVYHVSGDLSSFMLTWMCLCLPLIYIMRSSLVSVLYIAGITFYACLLGYGSPYSAPYIYWILLAAALPHYYRIYRQNKKSNSVLLHHWIVPLSAVIILGTLGYGEEDLMFIAYLSLFGFLYLIGSMADFEGRKGLSNGYLVLGALGTVIMLLGLSFKEYWKSLSKHSFRVEEVITAQEFFASLVLSLLAMLLLFLKYRNNFSGRVQPMDIIFLLFVPTFIAGMYEPLISVIVINLTVFLLGVHTIRKGVREEHLGLLNYGLLIISFLVICRFFDTQFSFVVRGVLFMLVGTGFFVINYRMLKKRKLNSLENER
jgi:uncharacterized membrane protein